MSENTTSFNLGDMCKKHKGHPCEFIRVKTNEVDCWEDVCKFCKRVGRRFFMCVNRPGHPCEFREKGAEEECIHCGRIGQRILFTGQEKVFQPGDEKKHHADEGDSSLPAGTTVSRNAYTSNTSNLSAGFNACDRTKDGVGKLKPKDLAIQKYRHRFEEYCTNIGLNQKTLKDCMQLFDMIAANSEKGISKREATPIMLGILFHSSKRGDFPLTVKYLSKITCQDEKTVRNGIKLVNEKGRIFMDRSIVQSSFLVRSNCEKLGMEKLFINAFVPNAMSVDGKIRQFLEGKKPATIAATDIYLTLKWFHSDVSKWSMTTIASVTGISTSALNNCVVDALKGMEQTGITCDDIVEEAKALCR